MAWQQWTIFDLSGLSEASSRIEHAISWKDSDQQIDEYGDDDDEYCEDDVEWHTGDCDDELEESAYTVGTRTDDTELREQFDGNLENVDASAFQVCASASRSFQEAREPVSRVKSARGYFPVVGIDAFDGLAQPSTDRKPAKSRGKGKKGKMKGKSSSHKGGKFPNLGAPSVLPNHRPHAQNLVLRCPRSARKKPAHHAPRLRLDQCMLCRQVGRRATECPNKGKTTASSPGKRAFRTYVLGCAVFDAMFFWCNCRRKPTRSRRE